MVRNAGLLPYTNQYVGCPRAIYDLRELVVWGMGPALGLTALVGLALALRADASGSAGPPSGCCSPGSLPFAAITMSFDVKFPRYLLPLYPLLVLWAAVALHAMGRARRLGRWMRAGVVAATACYLLAFCSIYTAPAHGVEPPPSGSTPTCRPAAACSPRTGTRASRSTCPGARATLYKVVDFPFYEPDTPAKVARLAQEVDGRRLHRPADQAYLRSHDPGATSGSPSPATSSTCCSPATSGFELRDRLRLPPRAWGRRAAQRAGRRVVLRLRPPQGAGASEHGPPGRRRAGAPHPRRAADPSHHPPPTAARPGARSPAASSPLGGALLLACDAARGGAAWSCSASPPGRCCAAVMGEARQGLWALGKPVRGPAGRAARCWWVVSIGWLPFTGAHGAGGRGGGAPRRWASPGAGRAPCPPFERSW